MSIKIVVADDHQMMREGLCAMLSDRTRQWQVVGQAQDGRGAIKLVRELTPDVAIIDVAMPGLNGIDATSRIVELSPQTKVIGLSMHSNADVVSGMLKAGAFGYVHKASAFKEIVTAIEMVTAGRPYLGSGVAEVVIEDFRKITSGAMPQTRVSLTPREQEVLRKIAEGAKTSAIAEQLDISVKTVETYRRQIMTKLDLFSVAELTKYAIRKGITKL